MATEYKILAQSAPSATTATDIFTVGSGKQVVVSTISVSNRGASAASYRIALRKSGATLANEHYIAYDVTVNANDTTMITVGFTLGATDVITVYATSANLSFGVFGSEIS
jgi:hypothetical protein